MDAKQLKERLDLLLVRKGLFDSREKARAAIMAGQVLVDGRKIDKPGKNVNARAGIKVMERPRYVSRGGFKLEKALSVFDIDLKGKIVLDIGSSTGGFTDCALQNGAQKVYAVDVGYGQLDWSLRNDPRVVVLERTNIRYLEQDKLDEIPDFVTIDVSFISLTLVLPRVEKLTTPDASGVALIKPQFEAGREKVGKKGVVRDPSVHVDTIEKITRTVVDLGWSVLGLDYSPVKGPEGNIEYLLYFAKGTAARLNLENSVSEVVKAAHLGLN